MRADADADADADAGDWDAAMSLVDWLATTVRSMRPSTCYASASTAAASLCRAAGQPAGRRCLVS
jgi:hypothetical protein